MRAGPLPARLGAGLFYAVNPFVFDRLYAGQLGVLLGYALLPFAVTALLDAAQEPHGVGRAACWVAATVAMSVHFVWILVPVTVAIFFLTRSGRLRASLRLGRVALGAAAISAYLPVPPLLVGARPAGPLGQLFSYRTRTDPRFGLLVNVAGLDGFFPGPSEPKHLFAGWPAVLAILVLVVAVGYVAVLGDAASRREGLAILAGIALLDRRRWRRSDPDTGPWQRTGAWRASLQLAAAKQASETAVQWPRVSRRTGSGRPKLSMWGSTAYATAGSAGNSRTDRGRYALSSWYGLWRLASLLAPGFLLRLALLPRPKGRYLQQGRYEPGVRRKPQPEV